MSVLVTAVVLAANSVHADPAATSYQTLSSTVHTDHWERALPRDWVASYNIAYSSSVLVTMTDYGARKRRCRYSFGNPTLARRFTYEGLHQARPYRVMHLQSGIKSWTLAPPAGPVDIKGSCSLALARAIQPTAARINAMPSWAEIIREDDASVRRYLTMGTKGLRLKASFGAN